MQMFCSCFNKAFAEHTTSIDEDVWKAIQEQDDQDNMDADWLMDLRSYKDIKS